MADINVSSNSAAIVPSGQKRPLILEVPIEMLDEILENCLPTDLRIHTFKTLHGYEAYAADSTVWKAVRLVCKKFNVSVKAALRRRVIGTTSSALVFDMTDHPEPTQVAVARPSPPSLGAALIPDSVLLRFGTITVQLPFRMHKPAMRFQLGPDTEEQRILEISLRLDSARSITAVTIHWQHVGHWYTHESDYANMDAAFNTLAQDITNELTYGSYDHLLQDSVAKLPVKLWEVAEQAIRRLQIAPYRVRWRLAMSLADYAEIRPRNA